ncbi:MAG: hypothetical protein C6Y22_30625 [Hapalosiphonaceae cyanobacterium JJU2]|nr:MAG: hypothetical protein C6Y22_30625 [Hapalosiphonaceae cyanobacterium JJU2]
MKVSKAISCILAGLILIGVSRVEAKPPTKVADGGISALIILTTVTVGLITYKIAQHKQTGERYIVKPNGSVEKLVIKTDDKGRQYVEVRTIEECNIVYPAIGRTVQTREYTPEGTVRCILIPENQ